MDDAVAQLRSSVASPGTRAARVAETVSQAHAGRRANQWCQPTGT